MDASNFYLDLDTSTEYTLSDNTKVGFNYGSGVIKNHFIQSDIIGDNNMSIKVDVGDLDGDGDLDIYTSNLSSSNRLWINNGLGNGGFSFTASDIPLDTGSSSNVSYDDIDSDGDIDIYVANGNSQQNKLWIDDGLGNGGSSFTASDITGDTGGTYGSSLGDLDGDGNLDIYVAGFASQNNLWINEFYQDSPYLVPNTTLTFTKKNRKFY